MDLECFPLFRGCTKEEIDRSLSRFAGFRKICSRNQVIVCAGDEAKWAILVLRGIVNLFDPTNDGGQVLMRVFEPGCVFMMSPVEVIVDTHYPCTLIAGSETELLFLDSEKIRGAWWEEGYRRFFTNVVESCIEYVRFVRVKLAITNLRNADDRILYYLRDRSRKLGTNEIKVPFATLEVMAEYLGVNRTSLSRSISALVRAGKIAHPGKGRFTLL